MLQAPTRRQTTTRKKTTNPTPGREARPSMRGGRPTEGRSRPSGGGYTFFMTIRIPVLVRGVLAAGLLTTTVLAQGPPATQGAPAPQEPPAVQVPPSSSPTFRMAIDLVTTDVIVRDGSGQFVADLNEGRIRGLRRRREAGSGVVRAGARRPRAEPAVAAAAAAGRRASSCRRRGPPTTRPAASSCSSSTTCTSSFRDTRPDPPALQEDGRRSSCTTATCSASSRPARPRSRSI